MHTSHLAAVSVVAAVVVVSACASTPSPPASAEPVPSPTTAVAAQQEDAPLACLNAAGDRPAEVACLLRATDTREFLLEADLGQAFLQYLESEAEDAPPGTFDEVIALARTQLAAPTLQQAYDEQLVVNLLRVDLAPVRAFYASELGRRYGAVDDSGAKPDVIAQWVKESQPSAERLEYFDQLLSANRAFEVIAIISTERNRLIARAAAMSRGKPLDEEKFAAGKAEVLGTIREHAKATMRYMMRDFNLADLKACIEHERLPASQTWTEAQLSALTTTLLQAYAPLEPELAEAMQRTREADMAELMGD